MQRLYLGLVNGSFGDPALYLELGGQAALFDCGDLRALSAARIHRLTEIAITHAHVDHVFGLDWLIRASLGRDRELRIYGPAGIADRIASKLDGYTWNIPLDFSLELTVEELLPAERRALLSSLHLSRGVDVRLRTAEREIHDGLFAESRTHRLRAVEVDHGTPCLGFAYEQKRGIRVRDRDIERLGLTRGEWIRELKSLLLADAPGDRTVVASGREFRLSDLAAETAEVVAGAKIAYVSDTLATDAVRARVSALAAGAAVFFCEAKYLARDRAKAQASRHLTAAEAAEIARAARAGELVLFHPSPRYERDFGEVLAEARSVFPAARFMTAPIGKLEGV